MVVSNIFSFTPIWGRFPFWLIFFKGVENQLDNQFYFSQIIGIQLCFCFFEHENLPFLRGSFCLCVCVPYMRLFVGHILWSLHPPCQDHGVPGRSSFWSDRTCNSIGSFLKMIAYLISILIEFPLLAQHFVIVVPMAILWQQKHVSCQS